MHHYSIERQMARIQRIEEWNAERAATIYRPTELLIIMKQLSGKQFWWDLPPGEYESKVARRKVQERYCVLCNCKHPVSEFSRDKSNHDGLAYACDRARQRIERKSWRRLYERRVMPKVA